MFSALHRTVRAGLAMAVVAAVSAVPATVGAASPGANGRIAFEMDGVIFSIQPTGAGVRALTAGPDDHAPRWSPNGRMIAFERAGNLWLMRADGTGARQFTSGPGDDTHPGWSPNGAKIVFVRSDDGSAPGRSMFVKPVAGGLPTRLTPADDGCANAPTWAADNRFVVYADDCGQSLRSVRKVNLKTGAISDVVGTGGVAGPGGRWFFEGSAPDVTPDGKNVVFKTSPNSSACGIGITDLSGGGFRQIAQAGECGVFLANDPAVSPNGNKLVYSAGNENLRLEVVLMNGQTQCCGGIFGTGDAPLNADWQPKP